MASPHDGPRPTAGVRLLAALTRASPVFSVAHMDARTIRRAQTTDLPDNPVVDAVLGRPRRDVRISSWSFAGPGGQVPVRVYTPAGPVVGARPVVLHLHGGGFVLGSARQSDWLATQVAAGVGAVVVAPDYRLAPTHRFPAAVEDAWAALQWVADNATEFGADPDRIAVMGDSAGGNLAAVLALTARDDGGPRLRHQGLVYPVGEVDGRVFEDPSAVRNTRPVVLSNEDMQVFTDLYLPEGHDPTDWRASPALAPDHRGLPPATVVLAGLDPLHDTGARYAQVLADAGVPVKVEVFHRMPHGFLTFPYLCSHAPAAVAALVRDQRVALL